jgi:hypothetical protein
MAMGILGEYIGRLCIEAKRRPLFVVDEHLASAASRQWPQVELRA